MFNEIENMSAMSSYCVGFARFLNQHERALSVFSSKVRLRNIGSWCRILGFSASLTK